MEKVWWTCSVANKLRQRIEFTDRHCAQNFQKVLSTSNYWSLYGMEWLGLFFLMPNKIILRRLVRISTNVPIAISAWVCVYVSDGVNSHFLHYSYWFIITNCAKFLDNKIKIEIWKTYVKLKQKLFRRRWNAKVNVQLCKHVTSCVFAYKIHFIYLSPAFHHAIVFTRFSNENTQWKQQSIWNNGNVKCIFRQTQPSNRDILFQKSFGLLVCMRNSNRPVRIINENTICCSPTWNNASWSLTEILCTTVFLWIRVHHCFWLLKFSKTFELPGYCRWVQKLKTIKNHETNSTQIHWTKSEKQSWNFGKSQQVHCYLTIPSIDSFELQFI